MAYDASRAGSEELSTLVDLLSHDMLNSCQATLSYLDLIHSHPDADQRTRDLAQRAASQVKTSSMLLDGIRSLMSAGGQDTGGGSVDLRTMLESLAKEISDTFPHKRVVIDLSGVDAAAMVPGSPSVRDLFGNLLVNIVQLHSADDVEIEVSSVPAEHSEGETATELVARSATVPQGLNEGLSLEAGSRDVSKTTRISGAVFAGSLARTLGGSMTVRVLEPERNSGCAFKVSLTRGCHG